jgi:hypothetical protein
MMKKTASILTTMEHITVAGETYQRWIVGRFPINSPDTTVGDAESSISPTEWGGGAFGSRRRACFQSTNAFENKSEVTAW